MPGPPPFSPSGSGRVRFPEADQPTSRRASSPSGFPLGPAAVSFRPLSAHSAKIFSRTRKALFLRFPVLEGFPGCPDPAYGHPKLGKPNPSPCRKTFRGSDFPFLWPHRRGHILAHRWTSMKRLYFPRMLPSGLRRFIRTGRQPRPVLHILWTDLWTEFRKQT